MEVILIIMAGALLLHIPTGIMFANAAKRLAHEEGNEMVISANANQRNMEALKTLAQQYRTGNLNPKFTIEDMDDLLNIYNRTVAQLENYKAKRWFNTSVEHELLMMLHSSGSRYSGKGPDQKTVELFCFVLFGNLLAPHGDKMPRTVKTIPQNSYLIGLLVAQQIRLERKISSQRNGRSNSWIY